MTTQPPASDRPSAGLELTPGGGLDEDDVEVLRRGLRRSLARLGELAGARTEISLKDRDTPGQRVTLEVWVPRLPRLVATSDRSDLASAAAQLDSKVTAQLNELLGRRQPRNNRQRRGSIRPARPEGDR